MSQNNAPVDRLVTLFGGGPVSSSLAQLALALAPEAIAADQGADHALALGVSLTTIIGDLDSINSTQIWRENGTQIIEIAEQETTDFEKCLYSVEAALYIGVGFLGGQVDHELACLNALCGYPNKRVVLLGAHDLVFLCPPVMTLDLPVGARVSFMPLGACSGRVCDGLQWPITGLDFSPDGRIGTSNRTAKPQIKCGFSGGPMLCLLAPEHRKAVVEMLGAPNSPHAK